MAPQEGGGDPAREALDCDEGEVAEGVAEGDEGVGDGVRADANEDETQPLLGY